jgi:hypothetical protein
MALVDKISRRIFLCAYIALEVKVFQATPFFLLLNPFSRHLKGLFMASIRNKPISTQKNKHGQTGSYLHRPKRIQIYDSSIQVLRRWHRPYIAWPLGHI